MTDYIRTISHQRVNVLHPRADQIEIDDIAHALSQQCRFAGHTREFYSTAQHCLLVVRALDGQPRILQLWGLLHDASEAYLSDLVAPLKHAPELAGYRAVEDRMMAAIARRFDLAALTPRAAAALKAADQRAAVTEGRDLFPFVRRFYPGVQPLLDPIDVLSIGQARAQFLDTFYALTRGREERTA